NETVNGVNTQVIWKTCKAGYLFELNAVTGAMIWSFTAPTSITARCHFCYMLDPLNSTEMNFPFLNPALTPTICTPCTYAFESEGTYDPATYYIYVASLNAPALWYYVAPNATNYRTNGGTASFPIPGAPSKNAGLNNSTAIAVNAATGQMVWNHFIPLQGYRGGLSSSGNLVFLTLSSGDLLMLNA